jgi:hypothetical protein
MFAPGWAAAPGCPPLPVVCHAPPSRSHDRDWSELIARIARRYPGSAGIEIWNEPNYVAFWMPRPDPARYAELLSEAYAAVKRAHPSMPVVSGGLGDAAPHVDGDISLEAFAQGLLRAGAITHIDAFGVHAYPLGSDEGPFLSSLAAIRRLRSRYGRPTLPLWITEVGVSTTGPGAVTAADQARELVDLFRRAEAMSDVQALFVHTLLEPPGAADNPEVGFGVLHTDGSPKPAATVLNRLLREQRRLRSENQAPR